MATSIARTMSSRIATIDPGRQSAEPLLPGVLAPSSPEGRIPDRKKANKAIELGRKRRCHSSDWVFRRYPDRAEPDRLANALLDAGEAAQSAEQFQACLRGPFAKDLDIRLGAARAFLAAGQAAQALEHLASMRAEKADFRAEAVSLLTARALAALDRTVEAWAEFECAGEATQRAGDEKAAGGAQELTP
jgi:hypothetical protein